MSYGTYQIYSVIFHVTNNTSFNTYIKCYYMLNPFIILPNRKQSLIHNFHDYLYESKRIITLPGTVIPYRLRKMAKVPLYRLRHRLKHPTL